MSVRKSLTSIIILLTSLTAELPVAFAEELFDINRSVRALGMGNAYTSVVRDADALFYNPAALAKISGYNWRIFEMGLGISGLEAVEKAQGIQDDGEFADTVRALYGEHVWAGFHGKTALTMPYVGVALYDSLDASLFVQDPPSPELYANVVNDYGIAFGFAIPILPTVSLGFVTKRITRMGTRAPFGASFLGTLDPDNIKSSVEKTGVGYSMDMGLNISVDAPVSPTLSFVWRNMGVTKFTPENAGDTPPPSEPDEMIVGGSILLDAGLITLVPSLDYRYLNRDDVQISKKINFGVEMGLPMLDIRGGFHQGYYTLGLGLNLGLLRVDAATYGVELGEYAGQLEDRRYLLSISAELGFDPSGGFLGGGDGNRSNSSGTSRRLKQRR